MNADINFKWKRDRAELAKHLADQLFLEVSTYETPHDFFKENGIELSLRYFAMDLLNTKRDDTIREKKPFVLDYYSLIPYPDAPRTSTDKTYAACVEMFYHLLRSYLKEHPDEAKQNLGFSL